MLERMRDDLLGSLFIFTLLMAFWLLISASVDWQHIIAGVLICSILTLFWTSLNIHEYKRTEFGIRHIVMLVKYFILLGVEIVMANVTVALIVLNPKMPISPGIVIMRCDLQRSLVRVLYVNSITLCPGTITVELEDNLLIVHAFTKTYAHEIEDWPLYRRLLNLEGLYNK